MSSSLPQSLAATLSVAGSSGGSWGDLAGELRLFMEAQQDALDTTRILNLNLSQEVDQLKAQLLAILTGGPSAGTETTQKPVKGALGNRRLKCTDQRLAMVRSVQMELMR